SAPRSNRPQEPPRQLSKVNQLTQQRSLSALCGTAPGSNLIANAQGGPWRQMNVRAKRMAMSLLQHVTERKMDDCYETKLREFAEGKRLGRLTNTVPCSRDDRCDACGST